MGKKRAVAGTRTTSIPIPSRRFVDVDLFYRGSIADVPTDLDDAVVRVRVRVHPDHRRTWEEVDAEALRAIVRGAHHAYPIETTIIRTDGESERRVIRSTDPEEAFREYVEGLNLGEVDEAEVLAAGIEILQECGL